MLRAALTLIALATATLGCGGPNTFIDASVAGRDAGDGSPADSTWEPCEVLAAPIGQLAYSTGGRWLAVAHLDGRVTLVRLPATIVRSIQAAEGAPAKIALTEDGGVLATSRGGTVKLWSTADGALMRTLKVGAGASVSLKFSDSPTPLLLATVDLGATPTDNVKVWRLSDGILVGQVTGSPLATFTHADEALLLLDEAGGGYQVLSFGGRVIRSAALPQPLARTAFAMDGAYLGGVTGAGTNQEQIAIMSVSDDRFVWQSAEKSRATRHLLFLENPSRVVQFAERALVYDHDDGKVLTALPLLVDAVAVTASPDGATIAATTPRGELLLVSSSDGSSRADRVPPFGMCPPK